MAQSDWHLLEVEAALQRLNTSDAGLSSAEVEQRVAGYGENNIPEGRHRSLINMLLAQFADFMIIVLLMAAVVSGFIGEPQDTIAILVIVLLNAIIGTVQEYRAERAVAALQHGQQE